MFVNVSTYKIRAMECQVTNMENKPNTALRRKRPNNTSLTGR